MQKGPAPAATEAGRKRNNHTTRSYPGPRPIETVLARFPDAKETRGGWLVHCPGPNHEHGDRHASLLISEADDGKVLLCCRSGRCTATAICAAIGLSVVDLFPNQLDRRRFDPATWRRAVEAREKLESILEPGRLDPDADTSALCRLIGARQVFDCELAEVAGYMGLTLEQARILGGDEPQVTQHATPTITVRRVHRTAGQRARR